MENIKNFNIIGRNYILKFFVFQFGELNLFKNYIIKCLGVIENCFNYDY